MADPLRPLRRPPVAAAASSGLQRRQVWVAVSPAGAAEPEWVKGTVDGAQGAGALSVVAEGHGVLTVAEDSALPANTAQFDCAEDLAALPALNTPAVTGHLRDRYHRDLIHTYAGLFCVIVNPFKPLGLYSEAVMAQYKGRLRTERPPHAFAVADEAFRALVQAGRSQSILCTGESGAGKTETTKTVLRYFAFIAASQQPAPRHDFETRKLRRMSTHGIGETATPAALWSRGDVQKVATGSRRRQSIPLLAQADVLNDKGTLEERLLQANPLLEAFGNACTTRNANSSRFGKYAKVVFDGRHLIAGATIRTYLLEKSRVVRQDPGERNFHCFYQLLNGSDLDAALNFGALRRDNPFLSNGEGARAADIDDAAAFDETAESLRVLGFSEEQVADIWACVAAVLGLGRLRTVVVDRRDGEQAQISDDTVVQDMAQRLGINAREFASELLQPHMVVGRDKVRRSQTASQVHVAIEALAKDLYARLFGWLVSFLNEKLSPNTTRAPSAIGMLDVAGFEIFRVNSFEQLCINFANERLQQLFNHRMFVAEQAEYESEHIEWDFIDFGMDLEPAIRLIDSQTRPPGVFQLLDDVSAMGRASDADFLASCTQACAGRPCFAEADVHHGSGFAITHYAGKVHYSVGQWLRKNRDVGNEPVQRLLQQSSSPFLSTLCQKEMRQISGRAVATVGRTFRRQVRELIADLEATETHFIRCIKPNGHGRPRDFDAPMVCSQLKCNGVLESIRIIQEGFPTRVPFNEFAHAFRVVLPRPPEAFSSSRQVAQQALQAMGTDPEGYRMGTSKVFFKMGVFYGLQQQRDERLRASVVGLQARCRGYLVRLRSSTGGQDGQAVRCLQRNIRAYLRLKDWPWWTLFQQLPKGPAQTVRVERALQDGLEKARADALRSGEESAAGAQELAELKRTRAEYQAHLQSDQQDHAVAVHAAELLERKLIELTEKTDDVEGDLEAMAQQSLDWKRDKIELLTIIAQLEDRAAETEDDADRVEDLQAEEARLQAAARATDGRLSRAREELHALKRERLTLREELEIAQEDALRSSTAVQQLQVQLEAEAGDLNQTLERSVLLNESCAGEHRQLDSVRGRQNEERQERDAAQGKARNAATEVLHVQNEIEDLHLALESVAGHTAHLEQAILECHPDRSENLPSLHTRIERLAAVEAANDERLGELEDAYTDAQRDIVQLQAGIQAKRKEQDAFLHRSLHHSHATELELGDVCDSLESEKHRRAIEERALAEVQSQVAEARSQLEAVRAQRHSHEAAMADLERAVAELEQKTDPNESQLLSLGLEPMEALLKHQSELQRSVDDAEQRLERAQLDTRLVTTDAEAMEPLLQDYSAQVDALRRQLRDAEAAVTGKNTVRAVERSAVIGEQSLERSVRGGANPSSSVTTTTTATTTTEATEATETVERAAAHRDRSFEAGGGNTAVDFAPAGGGNAGSSFSRNVEAEEVTHSSSYASMAADPVIDVTDTTTSRSTTTMTTTTTAAAAEAAADEPSSSSSSSLLAAPATPVHRRSRLGDSSFLSPIREIPERSPTELRLDSSGRSGISAGLYPYGTPLLPPLDSSRRFEAPQAPAPQAGGGQLEEAMAEVHSQREELQRSLDTSARSARDQRDLDWYRQQYEELLREVRRQSVQQPGVASSDMLSALQRLQAEVDRLQRENHDLTMRRELDAAGTLHHIETLEQKFQASEAERRRLTQRLDSERQHGEATTRHLEDERASLLQQDAQRVLDLERRLRKMGLQVESLRGERDLLQIKLQAAEHRLQEALDTLRSTRSGGNREMDAMQAEIDRLRTDCERRRQICLEQEASIESLERRQRTAEVDAQFEARRLDQEKSAYAAVSQGLDEQVRELYARLEAAEVEHARERDSWARDLRVEREGRVELEARVKHEQASSRQRSRDDFELLKLRSDLEVEKREKDALKRALQSMEAETAKLQERHGTALANRDARLAALQEQARTTREAVDTLKQERSTKTTSKVVMTREPIANAVHSASPPARRPDSSSPPAVIEPAAVNQLAVNGRAVRRRGMPTKAVGRATRHIHKEHRALRTVQDPHLATRRELAAGYPKPDLGTAVAGAHFFPLTRFSVAGEGATDFGGLAYIRVTAEDLAVVEYVGSQHAFFAVALADICRFGVRSGGLVVELGLSHARYTFHTPHIKGLHRALKSLTD